jgi:glutathione S-transferase
MSYTLYYNPDSANLVIRMVLEEMGLAYEDRLVPRKRVDRDSDFLRLNPRGLLPVLIDEQEDIALFETGAILLYLADKHGGLAPRPTDHGTRGPFLKWLFMLSNTLHADLRIRFYAERFVCRDEDMAPLLLATKQRVRRHFELIDRATGEHDGDWFLEGGLSVCDFYLGCCVRWAQMYPAEDIAIEGEDVAALPQLSSTLRKLQMRSSVQRALAREGIEGNAFVDVKRHLSARISDEVGSAIP